MTDLPTRHTIARRIRLMMEVHNLTMKQAATACHLATPSLEGYVRALNMPGGEAVAKLAKGLRCSADWLLSGEPA